MTTPPRILVVEDDPVNLLVITRMLKRLGHQPDVAKNGLEAVSAAAETDYDIIFMDVMMPELDGIQAAKRIRSAPTGRGPMIFAVTANVMPEDRVAALAAGMNDYVTKPIRMETIRSLIDTPKQEAGASACLDTATFDELREVMGDPEFFAELVTEFIQNSGQLVDDFDRAVTTGDFPVMERAAHTLKSTAATFGGKSLTNVAHRAEDAVHSKRREDLPAISSELRRERRRLCDLLAGATR